jgi:hypothetical protein
MTDETQLEVGDALIVIRDDDGAAYAVPVSEMEQFRLPLERRTALATRLREQGMTGAPPLYEVDPGALASYRLTQDEWTRLEATLHEKRSDVGGFEFKGQFPDWVAVSPRVPGARVARSHVHTLPSWYWFNPRARK